MSIQSEITRITNARDSSFTAVGAKGVTVPTGSKISDLPGLINQISTGASLNLTVVGGTTQPASPTENTIWVNTNVTISKWVVNHLPPDATEGTVWIKPTDNGSGNINIFNNIFINVGCVVQYVHDTWVGKDAKLYQNSNWSSIVTWLYDDGIKFVQFQAQLGTHGRFYDESDTNGYMRLTDNGTSAWQNARVHTSTIVNTQAMNTLHVSITPTYNTSNGYFDFGVASTNTSGSALDNDSSTLVASDRLTKTSWTQNVQEEWTCDISGVTQDAYVSVHVGNGSTSTNTPRIRIHQIWMT